MFCPSSLAGVTRLCVTPCVCHCGGGCHHAPVTASRAQHKHIAVDLLPACCLAAGPLGPAVQTLDSDSSVQRWLRLPGPPPSQNRKSPRQPCLGHRTSVHTPSGGETHRHAGVGVPGGLPGTGLSLVPSGRQHEVSVLSLALPALGQRPGDLRPCLQRESHLSTCLSSPLGSYADCKYPFCVFAYSTLMERASQRRGKAERVASGEKMGSEAFATVNPLSLISPENAEKGPSPQRLPTAMSPHCEQGGRLQPRHRSTDEWPMGGGGRKGWTASLVTPHTLVDGLVGGSGTGPVSNLDVQIAACVQTCTSPCPLQGQWGSGVQFI